MRRCLHAFLVGVLTLALTTDTARACWYLRRACRSPRPCVVVCPPPRECGMVVVSDVVVGGWHGDEASPSHCGCGWMTVVTDDVVSHGEPAMAVSSALPVEVKNEPVGQPTAVPTPDVAAAQPPAAPPKASLLSLEPTSEPVADAVQQTTALTEEPPQPESPAKEAAEQAAVEAEKPSVDRTTEPVEEPAVEEPAPAEENVNPVEPLKPAEPVPAEPVPAEPAPPVEPEEPNLFEEAEDAVAVGDPLEEPSPALDAGSSPAPAAEPAATEDAVDADAEAVEGESGDAGADESPEADAEASVDEEAPTDDEAPADDDSTPAVDEPADEPLAEEEPAPSADPFDGAANSGEPLRRWIDRSGDYAVVAALLDVRADGMCVLGAAGRTLTVPLGSLSDHDRDYAERAQQRLAARRAAEPEASDTASM
ncbi:MAG: hypothetical protein K8S94_12165 [Planctomycetia bacterium]|nr:hypothetical protein [Planctomycetia bacterium]